MTISKSLLWIIIGLGIIRLNSLDLLPESIDTVLIVIGCIAAMNGTLTMMCLGLWKLNDIIKDLEKRYK